MKTTFVPSGRYHSPGGTISFVLWENLNLQAAIRKVFNQQPNERIVEIVVEERGITARFEGVRV